MFCYLNGDALQSIYGFVFPFVCYELFDRHEGWWKNACQGKEDDSKPQYGLKMHGESHHLRAALRSFKSFWRLSKWFWRDKWSNS